MFLSSQPHLHILVRWQKESPKIVTTSEINWQAVGGIIYIFRISAEQPSGRVINHILFKRTATPLIIISHQSQSVKWGSRVPDDISKILLWGYVLCGARSVCYYKCRYLGNGPSAAKRSAEVAIALWVPLSFVAPAAFRMRISLPRNRKRRVCVY